MAMHEINGTELYVETAGEGPALLLLHGGLGLDHTYFRPYFDRLAERATVVYYDHRGNGRSARPADLGAELTFTNLVADAVGVLDALGLAEATVIGHSYGGFIAQELAIAHPDRLSGLVLLNTVPAFDYQPAPSGTDDQLAAFGSLFSAPVADDAAFRDLWSTVWPMYFEQWDDDEAARIDQGTAYSGAAWNAAASLLATFNTLEGLGGLTMPTWCVGGAHDFITPPEPGAIRLADRIPGAELTVFEASGHYPFIEEQDQFFAGLDSFLTGNG